MVTNDITLRVTDNIEDRRGIVIEDRRNIIIEDRRDRVSQFDLVVVKLGQNGALTVFDNASTATLLDENFVKENNLKVTHTSINSNVQGIGGAAKGKTVELTLSKKRGEKGAIIKASVVPNITNILKKDENLFRHLIQFSVNELKDSPRAEGIHESKFQQCRGGRIDMLIGQNIGQDYFPEEIATLSQGNGQGLRIPRH